MVVNCEEVWREISNYLDGGIEPDLRLAIEEHIRGCRHCAAVLDGTRNVVQLYGDERMLEVPPRGRIRGRWRGPCRWPRR